MTGNFDTVSSPPDAHVESFSPQHVDVDITEASLDERLAAVRAHKKKLLENLDKIERESVLLDEASKAHERFIGAVKYFNGLGDYAAQRGGASLLVLEAEEGVEKAVEALNKFRESG